MISNATMKSSSGTQAWDRQKWEFIGDEHLDCAFVRGNLY